jgi:hypothetical protein
VQAGQLGGVGVIATFRLRLEDELHVAGRFHNFEVTGQRLGNVRLVAGPAWDSGPSGSRL